MSATRTLFHWSLQADARAIGPHLVRAGFAVFMLFSITASFVDLFGRVGPGLRFFQSITFLNVVLITVSGVSYFVSAVTEEKDSGNLALLRLAGVTPIAIILSKSTSRIISSMMLLIAQLPFTFLAITLGGITWRQIISSYLALAAWMVFVANLSLICSIRCQTAGRAATLAVTILALFFTIDPIVASGLAAIGPGWLPAWFVDSLNALVSIQHKMSVTMQLDQILRISSLNPDFASTQFFWDVGAGLTLFATSVLMFNQWSQPAESGMAEASPAVRRWTIGRCWKLPMTWKEFLFFTGGWPFWGVKLLTYGMILAAFSFVQNAADPHLGFVLHGDRAWICFLTYLLAFYAEVLLYSAGSIFTEVRQSTLSSLAMIPISTVRLLSEKLMAAILASLPVLIALCVAFWCDPQGISMRLNAPLIVTMIATVLISSHITVLLSLYTRWAALPLALLLTTPAFSCSLLLIERTLLLPGAIASTHHWHVSLFLASLINLFWVWLFVLLPIQFRIVSRWDELSQHS
ncbi:MAG: hypothetical protein KDA91_12220 [Planctomycetaceae bacterium]|nr:hypothetical protein [Planctomycetaceae bacterium]